MSHDKRIKEHELSHKLFTSKKDNRNYYENKKIEFMIMKLYQDNLISLSEFQTLKKFLVDTLNKVKGRSN